jgi:hypothetical protein
LELVERQLITRLGGLMGGFRRSVQSRLDSMDRGLKRVERWLELVDVPVR